ncbi:H-NS histone family protein [Cupriavidus basilensis]
MATYKQLLAEKEKIEDATCRGCVPTEVAGVIEQIQALMAQYELSAEDIAPKRRRGRPASGAAPTKKIKASLPPKYQDPKTGATWTGRGRAPAWLGKNRDKFLIPEA